MADFLGSDSISMDSKGRIAIPAHVRESLMAICGGRIVLTANNTEKCVLVYPEPQWAEVVPKVQALPSFSKVARRTQRLLLGHAKALEIDAVGRVLVPPTLRSFANLDKKLLLIGQGKKLELWSEESWNAWLNEADDDGVIPPEMESLSL